MTEYLHGAYGDIQAAGAKAAAISRSAFVYIGTAPVHTVPGGSGRVNVPVLVNDISEATEKLGYSEDWASYTLCEAMHAHLEMGGVGPLVFINVLDPEKHKAAAPGNVKVKPVNGRAVIAAAGEIILDSLAISGKEQGVDYDVHYNCAKETITITERVRGGLGTAEIPVTYDSVDPSAVTEEDVIGATDNEGLNTGVFAVRSVYPVTGMIPAYMLAPGFSSIPTVHDTMAANSDNVGGHWMVYMLTDIPLTDASGSVSLGTAAAWKTANGYNQPNETPYFPLAMGIDGRVYHISVLAAANLQRLLLEHDGIPYHTASNTSAGIIKNLYMGEANSARVYDEQIINEKLNINGIASACFAGGRWVIWGCHSGEFDAENGDSLNVFDTNRMMLHYLINDFQQRRAADIDKPMTANGLKSIVAEEKARLDALLQIGALTYGEVFVDANRIARSDVMQGDFKFAFRITTTPLAKSLTAVIYAVEDGYASYIAELADN